MIKIKYLFCTILVIGYMSYQGLSQTTSNYDEDISRMVKKIRQYPNRTKDLEALKENYNLAAIVDASYWKVRNITLGYTFNETLLNQYGFQNLRVYMNITNPFVFTKYKGFDPEWAGSESRYDGPGTTTYQFGVNLKF